MIPPHHDAHQPNAQVHILRCTALLARHFAASSMSLAVTRSFDAARILTFGCMAAITDAVMRVAACDTPSRLSAHYAGTAGGPASPFGFELSGDFAVQSEQMKFVDPAMAVARAQVGSSAAETLNPRTPNPKTVKTGKDTPPARRPWPIQPQAKQAQMEVLLPAACSLLHSSAPVPCGSPRPTWRTHRPVCLPIPHMASSSAQVLHYFHQRSLALPEERLIFRWDRGMELGVGDRALLEQLAYELGFPIEGRLGLYLTGEDLSRASVMTEEVGEVLAEGQQSHGRGGPPRTCSTP